MAFKSKKNSNATSNPKPAVNTGNQDFDAGRMNAKGFDEKTEKPIRGEFWAGVGDVVDGAGKILLSPNFGMILGYMGAGGCLLTSAVGYSNLMASPLILAAPIALVAQFIQILPRLPKYFPEQADRLTLKLGLTRYLDPKEEANSPSLLKETKEWAREGAKRRQGAMETASIMLYIIEFVGASRAFQVFDPVTMSLIPSGVWAMLCGVIGFECCMIFVEWMKALRLTSRESRKYKELKRKQRIEAEQSFKA
jgi:hypothetical protein